MNYCEKCARCHEYGLRDDEECQWYGDPCGCNHPEMGFPRERDTINELERNGRLVEQVLAKVMLAVKPIRELVLDEHTSELSMRLAISECQKMLKEIEK